MVAAASALESDTIRLEMDTNAIADWNYIDSVEVLGSQISQDSVLSSLGKWSTDAGAAAKTVRVLYVPEPNANGVDTFEYLAR